VFLVLISFSQSQHGRIEYFLAVVKIKSEAMKISKTKIINFLIDAWRHLLLGGPVVVLEFAWNKTNSWSLADSFEFNGDERRSTSLSDTPDYVKLCKLASENDEILKKFKSEVSYMRILEHVDYPLGRKYLSKIENSPELITNLMQVSKSEIGSPKKYHFSKIGRVSPTQLRYAKVLYDLRNLFGSLDGFSVGEIGVGNGGQSLQIQNMYDLSKYDYFDLPEVQKLVGRILSLNRISMDASFPDVFNLIPNTYDLIIANYSFSELKASIQRDYLSNIILNSRRGYMILNKIIPQGQETVSSSDLLALLPGSEILFEDPLSHPANELFVWGHKLTTP
jgi:hypothetical protein